MLNFVGIALASVHLEAQVGVGPGAQVPCALLEEEDGVAVVRPHLPVVHGDALDEGGHPRGDGQGRDRAQHAQLASLPDAP